METLAEAPGVRSEAGVAARGSWGWSGVETGAGEESRRLLVGGVKCGVYLASPDRIGVISRNSLARDRNPRQIFSLGGHVGQR